MATARISAAVALIIGSGVALCAVAAQHSGIRRTDLQRADLSVAGREVVQVRVDFGPGAAFGRHRHPGEEIAYVIEGSLEYQFDGERPVTLEAGEVLFIPAGTIHAARTSARATGRSSPRTSSKRGNRESRW
jgi:quercetin dioxygenase-like cupin family protein